MLLLLIFLLTFIHCENEYIINEDSFLLVSDKQIHKFVLDDNTLSSKINYRKFVRVEGNSTGYIYDKYFPEPFFCSFDCSGLLKTETEVSMVLEGVSEKDEVLCRFKLTYNLADLTISDFYGGKENKLIEVQTRSKADGIFILATKEEDLDSIKSTLEYVKIVDTVKDLYYDLLSMFIDDITVIRKRLALSSNNLMLNLVIYEAEMYMMKKITTLLQSLVSLQIPSLRKMEYFKTYEYYNDKITEINTQIKVIQIMTNDKPCLKTTFSQVKPLCEKIERNLNRIDMIINNRTLLKSDKEQEKNIDKKLDKNIDKKLDKNIDKKFDIFVENYSEDLLKYCDIMSKINLNTLSRHFLRSKITSANIKELESIILDKLMAEKMRKCLLKYSKDKAEFKIFSHTDYFKEELSHRIVSNIDFLKNLKVLLSVRD